MALQDDPPKDNGLPKRCVPFVFLFFASCVLQLLCESFKFSIRDVQFVVSLAILGVY